MILFEKHRSGKTNYLYCQEDRNLNFAPHIHNAYEFIYVTKGELFCTVCGVDYRLGENRAMLIMPNEVHAYSTMDFSESFLCVFSSDYVEAFDSDVSGRILENPMFDFADSETVEALKRPKNKYIASGVLYGICGTALSSTRLKNNDRKDNAFEEKVLYYIQENYDKEISLAEAAKALGYNYSYLSRVFNKVFGVGFSAFVNEYRLSRACSLLSESDYSIMQVSNISGFNTLRSFNNAFLAKFGMSPSRYREEVKK